MPLRAPARKGKPGLSWVPKIDIAEYRAAHIAETEQAHTYTYRTCSCPVIDVTSERRRPHPFIGLVGGRWALTVLAELAAGGRRYQDLHDPLDVISHKVLTDTLRCAERNGLITGTSTQDEWTQQPCTC